MSQRLFTGVARCRSGACQTCRCELTSCTDPVTGYEEIANTRNCGTRSARNTTEMRLHDRVRRMHVRQELAFHKLTSPAWLELIEQGL